MNEKFEQVEKHLYQQDGRYYARFVCWDKIRRTFPLGENFDRAKAELERLHRKDDGEFDFDKPKREREQPQVERLTLTRYMPRFLETKKGMPSYSFWTTCGWHLMQHLGPVPLDEITRSRIAEYKRMRLTEPIYRYGKGKILKAVEGSTVRPSTVNREITALIGLLNLAADPEEGVLEKIPGTKKLKESEDYLARDITLEPDEYRALLNASPRWLQRVIIGAHEACLSRIDLLTLTWFEVHQKRPETSIIKVMGGRNKTRAKQKVPISPELGTVLDEIEAERRKLTNLTAPNLIFTRDGQPIDRNTLRKAFDRAKEQAKIPDLHFHDLRHCAVTRWTLAGIPEELRKLAAGHKNSSVHGRYFNPSDEQIVKAFAERLGWENGKKMTRNELQEQRQSAN
jgi:integrase